MYIYVCIYVYVYIYIYIEKRTCYAYRGRSALDGTGLQQVSKLECCSNCVSSRFVLIDVSCRAVRSPILCFSLCSHFDN